MLSGIFNTRKNQRASNSLQFMLLGREFYNCMLANNVSRIDDILLQCGTAREFSDLTNGFIAEAASHKDNYISGTTDDSLTCCIYLSSHAIAMNQQDTLLKIIGFLYNHAIELYADPARPKKPDRIDAILYHMLSDAAACGNDEIIEVLLQQGAPFIAPASYPHYNFRNRSPVNAALDNGHTDVAEKLRNLGRAKHIIYSP